FGLLGGLAARGIVAALSRTGVAIAALVIAVAATIGVGIMIASFREAVVDWLHGSLRADIYISPPSLVGNRPDATLDTALVSRRTYDLFWHDSAVSALALYAAPGVDVERLMAALRERAAGGHEVLIRSNRALRDASLEIFDRTFAITAVLRLLIVAVAFVGVLSALMALQLERAREHGVLRALGLTPGQVWGVVT